MYRNGVTQEHFMQTLTLLQILSKYLFKLMKYLYIHELTVIAEVNFAK